MGWGGVGWRGVGRAADDLCAFYSHREREREREIYIYIYIYMVQRRPTPPPLPPPMVTPPYGPYYAAFPPCGVGGVGGGVVYVGCLTPAHPPVLWWWVLGLRPPSSPPLQCGVVWWVVGFRFSV